MDLDDTNFEAGAAYAKTPLDITDLLENEKVRRRVVLTSLLENLGQYAPGKDQAMFYDGYDSDVSSRRALIIPYAQRRGYAPAYRVIVTDETTNDANISEQILRSREWAIRPVGRLMTVKECQLQGAADGTWQIRPATFFIQRATDSDETRVWHGAGYSPTLPVDTPTTTPLELLDKRIAAEELTRLLATLPVRDGTKTNCSYGLVAEL